MVADEAGAGGAIGGVSDWHQRILTSVLYANGAVESPHMATYTGLFTRPFVSLQTHMEKQLLLSVSVLITKLSPGHTSVCQPDHAPAGVHKCAHWKPCAPAVSILPPAAEHGRMASHAGLHSDALR